jgi:hypothetical protein
MNKPASPPPAATQDWRLLVEAAILETNPDDLSRRIQDAQDAIMDHIEDSFQTATQSERQSMINAMNSLRELRRLFQAPGLKIRTGIGQLSDA